MSDTAEGRIRKFRKLSDIYKQEVERIRGAANLSNGKSVAPKSSGAKRKTSLLKRSGKRGRKTSSSIRYEASSSRPKKVSPSNALSKFILSSTNDEIILLLGLIGLSTGTPATVPETCECVINKNPAEFNAEVATSYMRSC